MASGCKSKEQKKPKIRQAYAYNYRAANRPILITTITLGNLIRWKAKLVSFSCGKTYRVHFVSSRRHRIVVGVHIIRLSVYTAEIPELLFGYIAAISHL
jgi:hypothetical protein